MAYSVWKQSLSGLKRGSSAILSEMIQSHLCYRYTTRQKGGKFAYHIVDKSQAKRMTDDKLQMTDFTRAARAHPDGICHLLSVPAAAGWLPRRATARPCQCTIRTGECVTSKRRQGHIDVLEPRPTS